MSLDNIPAEIKSYTQWINWELRDGSKVPLCPHNGRLASVNDPLTWATFDNACRNVSNSVGLGFVFTKSDPFCGIDLDNKPNDPGTLAEHQDIARWLNSYTELSPSKLGVHVIVKAALPSTGRRRNGIECYDALRYFTFTGDVVIAQPIQDAQSKVLQLYERIGSNISVVENDGTAPETLRDHEVIEHALSASNGDKFKALHEGDWQQFYPSQSEADFAYINMLNFYSRNAAQTARLFRTSVLGRRVKGQRASYVNGMVRRSFDRAAPTVTLNPDKPGPWFDALTVEPWHTREPVFRPAEAPAAPKPVMPATAQPMPATIATLPGLTGDLARLYWMSAPHAVEEFAYAFALATMSHLAGRAYRYGQLNLSLYILYLGKTGVGKSHPQTLIDRWQSSIDARLNPSIVTQYKARKDYLNNSFINNIASGAGLAKQMLRSPSTLAYLDEFVNTIKRIGMPNANANDQQIRDELLQLINSAKAGARYYGKAYSTKEPVALPSVISANLTVLANGIFSVLFDDMSNALLQTGFIPRFVIFAYDGTMPPKNYNTESGIPQQVSDDLFRLFNHAFDIQQSFDGSAESVQAVNATPDAARALWAFDEECQNKIREAHRMNIATDGIWSRVAAHLNSVAALIAVGVNPYMPTITIECVDFAKRIMLPSLHEIVSKIAGNEVGDSDDRLEATIEKYFSRFQSEGWNFVRQYVNANKSVFDAGLVQTCALRAYCKMRVPMKGAKRGEGPRMFASALREMASDGRLQLIPGSKGGFAGETIRLI